MKIKPEKKEIKALPSVIGVYSFLKKGKPIYIGKSVNIKARLLAHIENGRFDKKEKAIVESSDSIEYFITDSEFKALILESKQIQIHKPYYNIRWKDDKSYLYLKINVKDSYPKLSPARREREKNWHYFGPFPSTQSVEYVLKEIRRIFPFCTQKNLGKLPCFYSKIGLCNPCPSSINKIKDPALKKQLAKEYRSNIRQVLRILDGKTEIVEKKLISDLKRLIKNENYEEAIDVRNRLYYFQKLIHQQMKPTEDADFNQSEKALSELESALKPYFPNLAGLARIECYDVSNLLLKEATASMVVMENGNIAKAQYRKFKIKDPKLRSDFEMIEETLNRRLKNKWPLPNLMVIDGGTPQVLKMIDVLKKNKLKIPLIGIAKHPDRIIAGVQGLPRIKMGNKRYGFNLIRRLRDESHRFARKYHLYLRDKSFLSSAKRYN